TAAFNRATAGLVNRQRAAFGLRPIRDVYESFRTVTVICQDEILGPVPEDCAGARQAAYLEAPHEGSIPSELDDFLGRGPPPVFVGFGSMPQLDGCVSALVQRVLEALGMRVIVQVGAD